MKRGVSSQSVVMILAALLCAGTAFARPWQNITPGKSTSKDVISQFGEPSRKLERGADTIYGYFGPKAIKGSRQAQVHVDKAGKVTRIDVFPSGEISLKTIEASYGPACAVAEADGDPCYVSKPVGTQQLLHYAKIGLAVFVKPNGAVQSLVFLPPGAATD